MKLTINIQSAENANRYYDFCGCGVCTLLSVSEHARSMYSGEINGLLLGTWKGFLCYGNNDKLYFTDPDKKTVVVTDNGFFSVDIYSDSLPDTLSPGYTLTEILHYIFQMRLILTGNLCIHGAAAIYRNEAVVFCGDSGAGKSTQANLWAEHLGAWILNYDKPALLKRDGIYHVHGTPWSGKERRCINDSAPLKALVFVVQDKNDHVVRLTPAQAFSRLYANFMAYPLNDSISEKYSDLILQLASTAPVYELYCTKSENAVKILYECLYGDYEQAKSEVSKLHIKDGFILRNIAGENIAFPQGKLALEHNTTIVLNETGTLLWRELQKDCTIEQLIAAMRQEYDVSPELAREDILAFIEKMRASNALDE